MYSAVQGVGHSPVKTTRDIDGAISVEDCRRSLGDVRAGGILNGGRRSQNQILHAAPVERQFQDSCTFHDLADAAAPCFNQGSVGLNLDLLGHLADLQNWIDDRIAIDL